MIQKVKDKLFKYIPLLIVLATGLLCFIFATTGKMNEEGYITYDGTNAIIEDYTTDFIEDSKEALNRIMNEDAPTDEATEEEWENDDAVGKGFTTDIDAVLSRRMADGNNDNGYGWQCSRYTGWLATGTWSYSSSHPDYGPVNGKDIASWLVNNYGFKYIDTPVAGAIGSGGFNTLYGHTAMYLYSTGSNTAMVNDANFVPLTVSTHNMNIDGWVWVVPGNYEPAPPVAIPEPEPTPSETPQTPAEGVSGVVDRNRYVVERGDTLGDVMLRLEGYVDWGSMNEYASSWYSTVVNPGQSVYAGWTSPLGVGLYAGDTIERR